MLGDRQKAWFAVGGGGDIKEIAVTLDKVTVQRVSYTCLLTYYFYGGVIYYMLNKLMTIEEDDYNSEGTARSVVDALCQTLGIIR